MAERTTQSWTTVPHFFLTKNIDATALNAARERLLPAIEQSHGVKITYTDLLVSVVGRTLRAHPRMNGLKEDVNVAIGIAVENAVVTGVVRHADAAAIGDVAVRRRELTERARTGRLQPSDIAEATSPSATSGCSASTSSPPSSCLRRCYSRGWRDCRSPGSARETDCDPANAADDALRGSPRHGRGWRRIVSEGSRRQDSDMDVGLKGRTAVITAGARASAGQLPGASRARASTWC
jgi:hypothetical protein